MGRPMYMYARICTSTSTALRHSKYDGTHLLGSPHAYPTRLCIGVCVYICAYMSRLVYMYSLKLKSSLAYLKAAQLLNGYASLDVSMLPGFTSGTHMNILSV